MKDYINGCYTKYGSRSLNCMEIRHKEELGNGLSFAVGYIPTEKDGISIDLMKDNKVIAWEHGIKVYNVDFETMTDFSQLKMLAISRLKEMKLIE